MSIIRIPFDELEVSTNTFLAITNITFDNFEQLVSVLPITNYIIVSKKRGRKKKVVEINPNSTIPPWSIITINTGVKCLGVNLQKPKKEAKTTRNWFRNSITIVMTTDMFEESGEPKKINFKICKNGKLQMTGCKSVEYAEKCVKQLWEFIKDTDVYKFSDKDTLECSFIPCMHNRTFDLGVNINRELIDWFFKIFIGDKEKIRNILCQYVPFEYINEIIETTEYRSMITRESVSLSQITTEITKIVLPQSAIIEIETVLQNKTIFSILETSDGYTGVNIKFQLDEDITSLPIHTRLYDDNTLDWDNQIKYIPYNKVKHQPTIKKIDKKRYITFLIFYSGKVILSGVCAKYQKNVYERFMDIVIKNSKFFVESLSE